MPAAVAAMTTGPGAMAADPDTLAKLKAEHAVTIVPAKAPYADSKPIIANISFVEQ